MDDRFEVVIGLEVHCQLSTRTKLFCSCELHYGADPNTRVCPVCLGLPGTLPVTNREAVRLATQIGRAVGGEVKRRSLFARKNYFYPDLPKGYQVTQYDAPIIEGGRIEIDLEGGDRRAIALTRIHLEEDAGKTIHRDDGRSAVDCNRAGTPLVEVVSEPVIRTAAEAVAYLRELRNLVRWLGVCDGHMERGSFRCDANISLRPRGQAALGTKVELKNLNSFAHIRRALVYEEARQAEVLKDGQAIVQETRLWDETRGVSRSMRSKEEAHDYRYFPEPDLPPVVVEERWLQAPLPELPRARRDRYEHELGLSRYDADLLTADKGTAEFFEATLRGGASSKLAANWIGSDLKGRLKADGRRVEQSPVSPEALATLLQRVSDKRLSGKMAKAVFARIYAGEAIAEVLAAVGEQITDTGAIEAAVKAVFEAYPQQTAAYRAGKTQIIGFLIGRVMGASAGKANPRLVREVLLRQLGDDTPE